MASAGKILIMPKGDYNSSTTYEMLDLVNHNGLPWLAKKTVVGVAPSETASDYWHPLFGDVITDILDVKGKFQKFKKNYDYSTSLYEADDSIVFNTLEEQTLEMFTLSGNYYVAKEDMTVYIKATVCGNALNTETNRIYAVLMYTPVGGTEVRWVEDVSYGTYSSITMAGAKQVKKGDKFRIHNFEKISLDSGFICRPSRIEFIHM